MAEERTTTDFQADQYAPPPPTPPPQHTNILILALIFQTMVALLQLKYQGSDKSPFDTHFAEMFLSVASFLIYCFSQDALLYIPPDSNYVKMVQCLASVFGPLTLASYLSLLFPLFCPIIYSISILYSAIRLLYNTFTQGLNWFYHNFIDTVSSENQITTV
ncbi:hypothetical protein H5410_043332 [Solanum commersonii]|uniref:Uncharacterized protein n=1 Tax=Solanum commersonii TaxID=4109 RepID=A0A9J5XYJ2_SOLCO|nr:hypothetical protein H5410_043332 [Solanum commersonii]